jgi:AraC-like DNA-binding protein
VKENLKANNYESNNCSDPLFPCGGYITDLTEPVFGEVPWHWHGEIEVFFFQTGTARLLVNGEQYILHKDEGAFINSNVLHSMRLAGSECVLKSFVFNTSIISGAMECIFEQRYIRPLVNCKSLFSVPFCIDSKWQRKAVKYLQDAYEAYSTEKYGYEFIVREKLSYILYLLITNMQPVLKHQIKNDDQNNIRLKKMINFIHYHYVEDLNLEKIASVANISERECLRCFHKTIRISPMQYLLKYRVSVSAKMLKDTNLSISEICYQSGFENTSYFTKIFKRFMLYTPTIYRKTD